MISMKINPTTYMVERKGWFKDAVRVHTGGCSTGHQTTGKGISHLAYTHVWPTFLQEVCTYYGERVHQRKRERCEEKILGNLMTGKMIVLAKDFSEGWKKQQDWGPAICGLLIDLLVMRILSCCLMLKVSADRPKQILQKESHKNPHIDVWIHLDSLLVLGTNFTWFLDPRQAIVDNHTINILICFKSTQPTTKFICYFDLAIFLTSTTGWFSRVTVHLAQYKASVIF